MWTDENKRQGRDGPVYYDENHEAVSPFLARYLTIVLAVLAVWGLWAAFSV